VRISQFANAATVEAAVRAAEKTVQPPAHVQPSLGALANGSDFGDELATDCWGPGVNESRVNVKACTFGDTRARRTMVLTGDSRAQMWFDVIDSIAIASHLKLVFLAKSGCPSAIGTFRLNNNGALSGSPWPACTSWHRFVISTIGSLRPQIVITASAEDLLLTSTESSGAAPANVEEAALTAFLKAIPAGTKRIVLGGFPTPGAASPTLCLSKNPTAVNKCAFKPNAEVIAENAAVRTASERDHALYIDQEPWLCASDCPAIIAGIIPYTIDGYHMDGTYAHYLTGVLWASLGPDLGSG
jgi:hypothetical protein